MTAQVAMDTGIDHPYLLTDVEIYQREAACSLREDLSRTCKEIWTQEAKGGPVALEPLPMIEGGRIPPEEVRKVLKSHQARDSNLRATMQQLEWSLDPGKGEKTKVVKKPSALQLEKYRLSPKDGVLEF